MAKTKPPEQPPKPLKLGSLLDEAKLHCQEENVLKFLAELMEFEKTLSYSYKPEITEMLGRHVRSDS